MWRMVRGWLDRGVDGFRLDTFNNFLKHPDLPSNPTKRGPSPWARMYHIYEKDQPDLPDLLAEFRAIVDEQPGRMSVGELFDGTMEQAAALTEPRHLAFDFELLQGGWSAQRFRRVIDRHEAVFNGPHWPTVVFSNHDQPRIVDRWGAAGGPDDIARAAAVLLLTLRGTAFIYYGEELGVPGIVVDQKDAIDPPAHLAGPDFPWWNRDQARAPMPWDGGPGHGFTTGRPWLPPPPDAATRNVAAARADPTSVLALYRRLIRLRRDLPALHRGALRPLATSGRDCLAYVRSTTEGRALVVVNLGDRARSPLLEAVGGGIVWRPVISTHDPPGRAVVDGGRIPLRPFEGVILVPEGDPVTTRHAGGR